MVLFRFFGRLCASGAEHLETCDKQVRVQGTVESAPQALGPPGTLVPDDRVSTHDTALAALHRALSGLSGSPFHRVDGLLEALLSPDVIGASFAAFYAVPESEVGVEESSLILLASAGQGSKLLDDKIRPLLPDTQQASIFKQMSSSKAPVHALLDRQLDPPSLAPVTSATSFSLSLAVSVARQAESPSPGINPAAAAAAAASTSSTSNLVSSTTLTKAKAKAKGSPSSATAEATAAITQRMRVAAVPLLHGSRVAGALWLEQPAAGPPPAAQAPLISDPRALQSLGFACAMCMLEPEGGHAAWLAAVLGRLGSSANMSVLISSLCAGVVAHVRRRFVLDGYVTAALVPSWPDAATALLLQPASGGANAGINSAATNNNNNSLTMSTRQNVTFQPGGTPASGVSGEGVAKQARWSPDGGGRPSSAFLMAFAAQQLEAAGAAPSTSALGDSALSVAASKRKLRSPATAAIGNNLVRDMAAVIQARFSLDTPRNRTLTGIDIPRSPSIGPSCSSKSIVIPLNKRDSTPLAAAAAAAASACAPALHARVFPLHRTLLQAHLQYQQQQQQQQQGRGQGQARQPQPQPQGLRQQTPSDSLSSGMSGAAGASGIAAGAAAISAAQHIPSATGVVEDTQVYVQNVHRPSTDVCMLMGLVRKTATGMSSSTIGGVLASGVGMAAQPAAAAAAAAAVGPAGVPKSLVLLTLQLGEGAALGLYVCFPRRLPGPLLEAVRSSCQELLDKALAPVVRLKVREVDIAPEYDTLCSANPGLYAVVRSASFCGVPGSGIPASLYMSTTVINSGLVPQLAGEPTAAALGTTPPELLSGELSTADMDVLMALQGQGGGGGAAGGAQAGGPQSLAPPDVSGKRGGSSSKRFGPAAAAGSFLRKSNSVATPRGSYPASPRINTATSIGVTTPTPKAGGGGGAAAAAAVAASNGELIEPLNLSQLLQSYTNDLAAGLALQAGFRTASLRSLGGLDPGLTGGGGGGGGFATTSIITVSGVDNTAAARQQLDLLVTSIHATINTDTAAGPASGTPMDDLDALELGDVLGQGGGGTVFKAKMGTLDVAVKLMELPKLDAGGEGAAAAAAAGPPPPGGTAGQQPVSPEGAGGAGGPEGEQAAEVDKLCLNARREMLRNATELAVQSRVSHPNIVQIYATYNDVVVVSKKGPPGCPGSTYRLYPAALNCPGAGAEDDGGKERRHVPCVAAAFELCDCGSLGGVLAARTFPRTTYRDREVEGDGSVALGSQLMVDMKGVYMTLLDVALALRHLHSLHLIHRDIKPANLLLKSNPRDHRGFTVKLADFGFVLHLNETAEDGTRYAVADQACGTVTHMAPEALLAKAKVDASVDMYAFGILMWEMFSGGVRPFPRLQPDKIPRAVYRGARPTFSEKVPATYRNLALACWSTDPHRRPRASDVVCLLNNLLQDMDG